jgi:ankyrin repeat protein
LPQTLPNTRILTYGYDTHIKHRLQQGLPVNKSTVYDIAGDLLVALEAGRRQEPERPVVFVVHSLGGIVTKEMLRQSEKRPPAIDDRHKVFESTVGVIFFGTPHSGADPRNLVLRVLENVAKGLGFSADRQIVNAILPSSERLRELREEFGPMAEKQKWIIYSFQETYGLSGLNNHKVVEDESSCLNLRAIEVIEHIGENHMEMCRFSSNTDVEYKKVAAALDRMSKEILAKKRDRMILLTNRLRFGQMNVRQHTIRKAHIETCRWLLDSREYLEWLAPVKNNEHQGFLWIKGKPGTGKSTLMKFAVMEAQQISLRKTEAVIAFFFNARGSELEKSTVGMYRSLLLQLLEAYPDLSLSRRISESLGLIAKSRDDSETLLELLKSCFEEAVLALHSCQGSLRCFIDALDECAESQIRDMIAFFQHLEQQATLTGVQLKILYSSRHYPHITIKRGRSFVLEEQPGHDTDVQRYVTSELMIGQSPLANRIRLELQAKSAGVFMWVALVVAILNKEYDSGRIHVLRQRLQELPGDLHELFRDILNRDQENKSELLACVQWILFARRPLNPRELYSAVLYDPDIRASNLDNLDVEDMTDDVIRRFILSASKGLAEITGSGKPTVQFMHESVRDFLLNESSNAWLDAVGVSDLRDNFSGKTHERLKHCCHTYLKRASLAIPSGRIDLHRFPLLEYAVENLFVHANTASGLSIDQTEFLQESQLSEWRHCYRLLNEDFSQSVQEVQTNIDTWLPGLRPSRASSESLRMTAAGLLEPCFSPEASLLYILASKGLSHLIETYSLQASVCCFAVEKEGLKTPLFAAMVMRHEGAVKALLQAQLRDYPPLTFPSEAALQAYLAQKVRWPGAASDFKALTTPKRIIEYIIARGDAVLTAIILATTSVPFDDPDPQLRTPLSVTVMRGVHEHVARLLIENGAAVDSADLSGFTPLSHAAKNGRKSMAELLLEKGANVSATTRLGWTPVMLAAFNGHESIAGLLATHGAVLNVHCPIVQAPPRQLPDIPMQAQHTTPLILAVHRKHKAIIALLIRHGADCNTRDSFGMTALLWAVLCDDTDIIRILLENGAACDIKDVFGRTPINVAIERNRIEIIGLLHNIGTNKLARSLRLPLANCSTMMVPRPRRVKADSMHNGVTSSWMNTP